MKKIIKSSYMVIYAVFFTLLFISCNKDDDTTSVENPDLETEIDNEVHEFVWNGLNQFYLWKDDVRDLADDRFPSDNDFNNFLNSHQNPEDIFEALLYQRGVVDKFEFSKITDDLTELERSTARLAVTNTNGLNFALGSFSNSNNIFGVVQYVIKNSDASTKDIKRGDIFLTVDGQELTTANFNRLLFEGNDTYTLGLGELVDGTIFESDKTVELTKNLIEEDPILLNDILEIGDKKIGYIMYNSFLPDFDEELNDIFGDFNANGVTDLVLDFRYNPGGDVFSAVHLSSMVTGQFTGELLMQEQWNDSYQEFVEQIDPDLLKNKFTDKFIGRSNPTTINSLNLSEVYILTTQNSASASELVINCLKPYINVVHIGEQTFGKYVGSIAVFDSPSFTNENVNSNHTYAMQPITFKVMNANGVTDYINGLTPNIQLSESLETYGTLGDPNEPLLAEAIALITGASSRSNKTRNNNTDFKIITTSKDFNNQGRRMFLNKPVLHSKTLH